MKGEWVDGDYVLMGEDGDGVILKVMDAGRDIVIVGYENGNIKLAIKQPAPDMERLAHAILTIAGDYREGIQ